MNSSMNVGVSPPIAVVHRLDHRLRSLSRSPVVEIDQRPVTVNRLIKDWEIATNHERVKLCLGCVHDFSLTGNGLLTITTGDLQLNSSVSRTINQKIQSESKSVGRLFPLNVRHLSQCHLQRVGSQFAVAVFLDFGVKLLGQLQTGQVQIHLF